MAPKKGKGKGKGKQLAPKGPAPKEPVPTMSASSDDEADDPVNASFLQRLEALVKKRGGPVAQLAFLGEDKRPRPASNQSFQVQVLASLAVLEDNCGDAVPVLPAAGDGQVPSGPELTQLPGMSTSKMMVYSGAPASTGKSSSAVVPTQWPWGPGSAAGTSGQSWQGALQSSGASMGTAVPGWVWAASQVLPQYGFGSTPWTPQHLGSWPGCGLPSGVGSPF